MNATRISLRDYGLPTDFFTFNRDDAYCNPQIICYRSILWLDPQHVAVVFSTSARMRKTPKAIVQGKARILLFDMAGKLVAKRDIPYAADGNGELVADGEALPGPTGTLIFRIQSVELDPRGSHESESGVLLLDAQLRDVVRLNKFLYQTTFVKHTMVFQGGKETYELVDDHPSAATKTRSINFPAGTMDRKIGDSGEAYFLCEQEIGSGNYQPSAVIYPGVHRRCEMNYEENSRVQWSAPLAQNEVGQFVGLLTDGSVAAVVRSQDAERLVLWRRDAKEESLPWIAKGLQGDVITAMPDMQRYGAIAVKNEANAHWLIFDRRQPKPLVERPFPVNGKAALSPDGARYATFEAGELRLYSLSK